ncbi:TPA: HIT family protein [Patescibacteria group bacterium]|nr:HIT family protein [Patescibacteria group bacterium]HAM96773.1 HIT family protein [Patescibacteria group bacterium]
MSCYGHCCRRIIVMDDCIFCKIAKGEVSSFKIYEDDNYFAFLDISNFTPGHTLVIPKKHYRFVWDVENIEGYFKVVQKIANHFRNNLKYTYVDTLIFGRMVPHAHVHVVPHNHDSEDWKNALKGIGELQRSDSTRRLCKEDGERIAEKFRID